MFGSSTEATTSEGLKTPTKLPLPFQRRRYVFFSSVLASEEKFLSLRIQSSRRRPRDKKRGSVHDALKLGDSTKWMIAERTEVISRSPLILVKSAGLLTVSSKLDVRFLLVLLVVSAQSSWLMRSYRAERLLKKRSSMRSPYAKRVSGNKTTVRPPLRIVVQSLLTRLWSLMNLTAALTSSRMAWNSSILLNTSSITRSNKWARHPTAMIQGCLCWRMRNARKLTDTLSKAMAQKIMCISTLAALARCFISASIVLAYHSPSRVVLGVRLRRTNTTRLPEASVMLNTSPPAVLTPSPANVRKGYSSEHASQTSWTPLTVLLNSLGRNFSLIVKSPGGVYPGRSIWTYFLSLGESATVNGSA
mmetsp:Transcript_7533/g.20969  ORF Transcript_7533/g.20969 Transcript_7533/m.20969 type:complete len:361 (-) Transcript_7533:109-1191(-)